MSHYAGLGDSHTHVLIGRRRKIKLRTKSRRSERKKWPEIRQNTLNTRKQEAKALLKCRETHQPQRVRERLKLRDDLKKYRDAGFVFPNSCVVLLLTSDSVDGGACQEDGIENTQRPRP